MLKLMWPFGIVAYNFLKKMKAAKSKHRKFMKDGTHMELLIGTIWLLNSLSWLSVAEAKQLSTIDYIASFCM